MSDFSQLLGQLNESAAKAVKAQQTSQSVATITTSERNKKRIREGEGNEEDHQSSGKRNCSSHLSSAFRPPSDINQLSVNVSFLCIGAQKAGTTWLHQILSRHTDLSLPEQKEVHFWDWNRRKGLGWYSLQFSTTSHHSSSALMGEITPCYILLNNRDLDEIHHLFPKIKLIFIARDPIERAWSALLMELRNSVRGMEAGKFSSADNDKLDKRTRDRIEEDANPDKYDDSYFMERLMHSTHTDRSDYAKYLRGWISRFSTEQLLIVNFDSIAKNPREVIKDVCSHIEVDSELLLNSLTDDEISTKINSATGMTSNRSIPPSLRKKMKSYLLPFIKDFNSLLEELNYSWKLPS